MKRFIYISLLSFILISFSLTGCDQSDVPMSRGLKSLTFLGELNDLQGIATRGPLSYNLSRDSFDTKFYIERIILDNESKIREKKCGTYLIPEDHKGVFAAYQNVDSLNWSSNDSHIFYGWTMPWIVDYINHSDSFVIKSSQNYLKDTTLISFRDNHPMYEQVTDNKNCKILETFIGAKTGPVNYVDNGEYVVMQFQHLVSKILIGTLRFSTMDDKGNITNHNVKGKMTFEGIPSEGLFIRQGPDRPMVIAKPDAQQQVTYEVGAGAVLYICPDRDFSNVKFRITAESGVTDQGEFLGDFKSVTFQRPDNDEWDNGKDAHTLYAGEMMTMNINLRQGTGVLFSTSITSWTDDPAREATAHPKEGIYDVTEMQHITSNFGNANYTREDEERICEMYGDTTTHEYKLYTDLDNLVHSVRAGKNHVIDGMGHTLNFSQPFKDESNGNITIRVRITKMKNIYISDNEGHKIYIDDNFKIFIVKSDGTMEPTEYSLDEYKDGNMEYIVNLETGYVGQSKPS